MCQNSVFVQAISEKISRSSSKIVSCDKRFKLERVLHEGERIVIHAVFFLSRIRHNDLFSSCKPLIFSTDPFSIWNKSLRSSVTNWQPKNLVSSICIISSSQLRIESFAVFANDTQIHRKLIIFDWIPAIKDARVKYSPNVSRFLHHIIFCLHQTWPLF